MFKRFTNLLSKSMALEIKPSISKYSDRSLNHGLNVIIEGNIGSGKTTLINDLKNFDDRLNVFCEPIEKWRDVNGVNLFDLMYKEPERYGFLFQSYVQLTMLQQHELIDKLSSEHNQINFSERSIISARYIFVENLFRKGMLTKLEYGILSDYFNHFVRKDKINIDLIVYLRSTPELCYQRVVQRSRPEENCLKLEDFAFFHELHEEFFGSMEILRSKLWEIPMLIIDAETPKETRLQLIQDHLSNFLDDHRPFLKSSS